MSGGMGMWGRRRGDVSKEGKEKGSGGSLHIYVLWVSWLNYSL